MDELARARTLARCPLLADLPERDLRRLAAAATVRHVKRGQLVFTTGDAGDSLIVVADGRLKAFHSSPEGEELLLDVVDPGGSLGELTVADGGPRSLSASALTNATLLRVPRGAILEVAATSPALTSALLAALAAVVRRLTGSAADLVFLDSRRRIAKLVLQLCPPDGARVRTGLTQGEMAERVGTSRQSLNTALQDFQRRGWLTVSGGDLALLDAASLRRFVGD